MRRSLGYTKSEPEPSDIRSRRSLGNTRQAPEPEPGEIRNY